jgi:hypothetical protein
MNQQRAGWPVWALACAFLALTGAPAAADGESTTAEAAVSGTATPVVDPEAKALLVDMAAFLAKAPAFTVTVRGSYDAVQPSGQKIEFNELRRVAVSRPDKLRVAAEHSDGSAHELVFDGKEIAIASTPENVYATAAKPGSIDEAVVYFRKDLRMRLPLAALLVSNLPAEFERRVTGVEYVEETAILGAPAHHLSVQTDTVDFQVWIADGAQPLPQRVVLTYKLEEGQPQFRASFEEWKLSPAPDAARFTFTPPEGARRIAFLSQLPRAPLPAPAVDESKGATP